jgi:hypothetical protein
MLRIEVLLWPMMVLVAGSVAGCVIGWLVGKRFRRTRATAIGSGIGTFFGGGLGFVGWRLFSNWYVIADGRVPVSPESMEWFIVSIEAFIAAGMLLGGVAGGLAGLFFAAPEPPLPSKEHEHGIMG